MFSRDSTVCQSHSSRFNEHLGHVKLWPSCSVLTLLACLIVAKGFAIGFCPDNCCDKTVKFGIYDLFLCPACDNTRDAVRSTVTAEFKEVSKKATKQPSKRSVGGNTVSLSSNTTIATSQAASKNVSSGVIGSDASVDGASSLSSPAAAAS